MKRFVLWFSSPLCAICTAGFARASDTTALQWNACDPATIDNGTLPLPLQCSTLPVPLDYTNSSSNETIILQLIKYPAEIGPAKGSIILNFGGPGEDAHLNMGPNVKLMKNQTGGQYDLVSFDPRGTGNTLPFTCFTNDSLGEAASVYLNTTGYRFSDTTPGHMWAAAEIFAESCYYHLKSYGDLVGMAFTARDMMRVVDALNEDGKLRYWGISGGTVLGATVAAMFPDRMDKVVLDGVVNSHEYYHAFGNPEMFASSDETLKAIIAACLAHRQNCPLARGNRTVHEITSALDREIHKLKYNPVVVNETIIDSYKVEFNIISNMYAPSLYPNLAAGLNALLDDDIYGFIGNTSGINITIGLTAEAERGITCGDKIPRAASLEEAQPGIDSYLRTSKWFGGSLGLTQLGLECSRWLFEAKERYNGTFQVRTAKPLLFIGNTYDPVTPLKSAKNMSSGFEGSVVLEHGGFGHLSFSDMSDCTNKFITNYFQNGTLPPPNTKCATNKALFDS